MDDSENPAPATEGTRFRPEAEPVPGPIRAATVIVYIVAGMYALVGAIGLAFGTLPAAIVGIGVAALLVFLLAKSLREGRRGAQLVSIFMGVFLMLTAFSNPTANTFILTFLVTWGLGISLIVLVTAPRSSREWFHGRRR